MAGVAGKVGFTFQIIMPKASEQLTAGKTLPCQCGPRTRLPCNVGGLHRHDGKLE
jgi:hypothetical protein